MKHANVSVFIPHLGCPHQCSFCSQREISGEQSQPDERDVVRVCEQFKNSAHSRFGRAELAFFGGSFTAVEREYSERLLRAAAPYLESGLFFGIRVSTRPDCIDGQTLDFLKKRGVTSVELGAQSMSDEVLAKNRRGHTAHDVIRASKLIRESGLELGLQMMTGLYGSGMAKDMKTAGELAALEPRTVRVYPTLVLRGTPLEKLWRSGAYRPQTLPAAVGLGARMLKLFTSRGISVARMGLHAERSLEKALLAGPYHPAYRELCEGALMRHNAHKQLRRLGAGSYALYCSPQSVSKLCGHGARAAQMFKRLGYDVKIKTDASLSGVDTVILPLGAAIKEG